MRSTGHYHLSRVFTRWARLRNIRHALYSTGAADGDWFALDRSTEDVNVIERAYSFVCQGDQVTIHTYLATQSAGGWRRVVKTGAQRGSQDEIVVYV